jgi:hypothetical protein
MLSHVSSRARDIRWLTYLLATVFRLGAKPNGLAQIQASPGSGPSESEGALAVLTAPRRNAGIRQSSASQK